MTREMGFVVGATGLAITLVGLALVVPRLATANAEAARRPSSSRVEAAPLPTPSTDAPRSTPEPKGPAFPDLTQTDPDLGLPGGGNSHCGPVAVSNSLMWLALNDYPDLAPRRSTARERQLQLVRQLSSYRYMATSPSQGTGPTGILEGVERWVKHSGYEIERLEYQGWRGHPIKYATHVKEPRLDWVRAALIDGGAAWLHVGWYQPPTRWEPAHRRRGGHWLTVVEVHGGGELSLHDPAPYAGDTPSTERVTTRTIGKGWLLDGKTRLRADGHLVLEGGMHVKREDDVAIVDGAVALVLKPPHPSPQTEPSHRQTGPTQSP